MGIAAAVAGAAVAGVAGSALSSSAASKASGAQTQADQQAAAQQQDQFAATQANLAPYNTAGQTNLGPLQNFYQGTQGALNTAYGQLQAAVPQAMTQAQLEQTPGYQFQLSQGLKAAQNNAASKGLGVSGAAMTAADTYATGLANSNYQTQFGNQQQIYADNATNYNNLLNGQNAVYAQLSGPVTLGENAAATTGAQGVQSSTNVGNDLTNSGNAASAGISASNNAVTSGLTTAGNSGLNYLGSQAVMNSLNGNQGYLDTTSQF